MKNCKNIITLIAIIAIIPCCLAQSTQSQFEKAKEYYNQGNFGKAIDIFEELIEIEPYNDNYHYWLGASNIEAITDANLFAKAGLAYSAKSSLEKAIELNPKHLDARIRLANYYINAPAIAGGSYSKALIQSNEIKELDSLKGMLLEASIYLKTEEFDKAEKIYLEISKSDTNYKQVFYQLSVISLSKKDYNKGLEYCKLSIEKYPAYLMGYYQYGKIASISALNIDEGIDHLKIYLSRDLPDNLPEKHWAYFRLGKLYELKVNISLAKQAYEKSLELKPGFDESKDALKNLKQ